MKNIRAHLLLLTLGVFAGIAFLHAQEKEPAEVKKLLDSKNYIFKAEYVFTTGTNKALSSDYDLKVTPDTVESNLPYFGRAYSPPIDPSKGGIKFTSADFDYKTEKKSDRWEIEIKPRNEEETEALFLTIFDNGQASLRVESKFRQSISFSGVIVNGKS